MHDLPYANVGIFFRNNKKRNAPLLLFQLILIAIGKPDNKTFYHVKKS